MLEAVNSVLQNAPFVKGNAEQVSPVDSFGGNPDRVQKAPQLPKAPYISPFIQMDLKFDQAVLQIRDSETGDVLRQYPSEPTLRSQQLAEQNREARTQESSSASVERGADIVTASETSQAQTSQAQVSQQPVQATAQQLAAFDAASRSGSAQSTTTVLA